MGGRRCGLWAMEFRCRADFRCNEAKVKVKIKQSTALYLNICLVLFSVALTLLSLEVVLRVGASGLPDGSLRFLQGHEAAKLPDRLVFPPGQRGLRFSQFRTDRDLGYRYPPGTTFLYKNVDFGEVEIKLDKQGFRNRGEAVYQKAQIVVMGDSYTLPVNISYEASWPRIVEARTGQALLNLGVASYDFYQYQRLLPLFAEEANPRWVVLAVFQNDFWCIHEGLKDFFAKHPEGTYMEYRLNAATIPGVGIVGKAKLAIRYFVEQRSYLIALIRLVMNRPDAVEEKVFLRSSKEAYISVDTRFLAHYPSDSQLKESCAGRLARESVTSILQWAGRRNAKLLVVYIPQKEEVYLPWLLEKPNWLASDISDDVLTSAVVNAGVYGKYLERLSQEMGFGYINMTSRFRQSQDGLLYLPVDGHTNIEGGNIIASAVSDYLLSSVPPTGKTPQTLSVSMH